SAAREEVFSKYAPDPSMRIYGRGIRRRLPPMLDGDRRQIELVHSLVFSLPGTPVIRYGDEIGMGDDPSAPGRLSVRTPMQWTDGENGGFSTAPPERLVRPMVTGEFGPERVNVVAQRRDPESFFHFMRRLIHARRECPELGSGTLTLLESGDPAVLAHRCDSEGGGVVGVHNLSSSPRSVHIRLGDTDLGPLIDLFGDRTYDPVSGSRVEMRLKGYGYRWLRTDPLRRDR